MTTLHRSKRVEIYDIYIVLLLIYIINPVLKMEAETSAYLCLSNYTVSCRASWLKAWDVVN